jgi:signal transduction histidine kinase
MKLLIAEDDLTSRSGLSAFLKKSGYCVTAAADGLEAWNILRNDRSFDLALLDWNMPGMSGVDLCRRIKGELKAPYIYVIVLTSKNKTAEIVEAFEAGADDYISKPPDMAVLCARINAGLRIVAMQNKLGEYARDMELLATERAVQLAQADRLVTIGLLSAGVAHEINNPASNISVNLQTISKNWPVVSGYLEGLPAPSAEGERARIVLAEMPNMVREMQNGVIRIKKITDGLKTYVRPGSGLKKTVNVNCCAEEALKLCGGRFGRKISIARELAADLPGVAADEGQIEQVVINLLINAADALEGRERGKITLQTAATGESVVLFVRDNGPGIPEEAMGKIFKAFFTTKETGKGTGLGLFISQSIIEGSGGAISAKNHQGGGAEFAIKLPAILSGKK